MRAKAFPCLQDSLDGRRKTSETRGMPRTDITCVWSDRLDRQLWFIGNFQLPRVISDEGSYSRAVLSSAGVSPPKKEEQERERERE